jgi:hypothetical protein
MPEVELEGVGLGVGATVGTGVAAGADAEGVGAIETAADGVLPCGEDAHPIKKRDNADAHIILLVYLEIKRFTLLPAFILRFPY